MYKKVSKTLVITMMAVLSSIFGVNGAIASDPPVIRSSQIVGGVQYIIWTDNGDLNPSVKITDGYVCTSSIGNCTILSHGGSAGTSKGIAILTGADNARNIIVSIHHIERYVSDNHLDTLTSVLHLRSDLVIKPTVSIISEIVNEGIGSTSFRVKLVDTRTVTTEPLENYPVAYYEGIVPLDGSTGSIPSTEYLSTFRNPEQISDTQTETIGQIFSTSRIETFTAQIGKFIKLDNREYASDIITLGPFVGLPRSTIPLILNLTSTKTGCAFRVENFDNSFKYKLIGASNWMMSSNGDFTINNLSSSQELEISIETSRSGYVTYNGFYTTIFCSALPESVVNENVIRAREEVAKVAAREEIRSMVTLGTSLTSENISKAGYTAVSNETLNWLNSELASLDKSEINESEINFAISKAIYLDKITNTSSMAINGRELERLNIVPIGIPRESLASSLENAPLNLRDSIEKVKVYVEEWIKRYELRNSKIEKLRARLLVR